MLLITGSIFFGMMPSAHAQENFTLGHAGSQAIDQNFISALQLLSPDFGFSPNKDAFDGKLFKSYIKIKAKADIVRSLPVFKSEQVQKQLALVRQLAEEKYLASLYEKNAKETAYTVTDAEAREYYDMHILQFTQPGLYSYFTAYISDTLKNSVAEVEQQLKQYAAIIKDNFKTGDKNSYSIIYEKEKALSANEYIYTILSKMKTGDYSMTSNGNKGLLIYMLSSKTAETVSTFDNVKDQCKAFVMNVKKEKAEQDFVESARKKYPVTLDSPLFK